MDATTDASFAHSHAAAPGRAAPMSRFGRLFERHAPLLGDAMLLALAATMNEGPSPGAEGPRQATSRLQAGLTYLGQFIDHDLTLDRSAFDAAAAGGQAPANFRTPAFDLDALYGDGPDADAGAGLYDPAQRGRLRLDGHDFVREADGTAHIADPRNDSNRIVSQIHLAMARYHNRALDAEGGAAGAFERARAEVRRHYQWIVLHEFLPVLAGDALVASLRDVPDGAALRLFPPVAAPQLPIEFTRAAFRFGHSMVRSAYRLNAAGGQVLLFPVGGDAADPQRGLRGHQRLPPEMVIEWERFFEPRGGDRRRLQLARPIDTSLALAMFALPASVAENGTTLGQNLAYRNLKRGETEPALPSGQEVGRALVALGLVDAADLLGGDRPLDLRVEEPVPGGIDNLAGQGIDLATLRAAVSAHTPLWYYVLHESRVHGGGERLGPVGARIVAEVVLGIMWSDPGSILRADAGWAPRTGRCGCPADRDYRMTDLLAWAGGG